MKTTDLINQQMQAAGHSTYDSHPDHEVQMARSELYRAGKCAVELHNMLKGVSEQQGLEGWVQAKITKAADYLESVYHYLDYEIKSPSEPTYESKRRVREAAPVGNQAPVAPGQVPPGQQAGAAPVDPNQMSKAQMAGQMLEKRKEIMKELQQKEQEVAQLRQQLTQIPAISETTSAGAIASSIGSNGLGKKKKEIGSLFGGTFKQNEAANPAQQAAIAIAKKKSGKYDKEGKRIREDDDLDHVIGIRNKMNAATDPAEKSRLQQQYDRVISTFSRIPPTSFPATDQPAKQDQPTSEAGNPAQQAAIAIAKKKKMSGKDRHRMREQDDPLVKNLPTVNLTGGSQARSDSLTKMAGSTTATPAAPDEKDIKKGASMESSIGPKFTGYWKGTDKSKPGKRMVGSD